MDLLIAALVSLLALALGYRFVYHLQLLTERAKARLARALRGAASPIPEPGSVDERLAAAGFRSAHPRLAWPLVTLGLPAAGVVLALTAGFPPLVSTAAGLVAWIGVRRWLDGRARDRGRGIDEQLPLAYARLVSILRANADVTIALRETAEALEAERGPTPLSEELRRTAAEAGSSYVGRELALLGLQRRAASTSLRNLGLLLERFALTSGGESRAFFEAFEAAAANVQAVLEARARAKAKSAEQLLSARTVPLLLGGTLLFFMNDPGFRTSFQLPLVQAALAGAAVVMAAGYGVMSDIAREAV